MEPPKYEKSNTGRYSGTALYESARETAVKVLNRIERTDSYLDKLLDFELRSPGSQQIR